MNSIPLNASNERRAVGRALARCGPIVLLGVLGAASIAGQSLAQSVEAVGTFGLRANGGALHSVQSNAVLGVEVGTVRFVGSAVDPGGAWEASWDYTADLDPNGNAKLNGSTTIVNKSAQATDFDLSFEVPICPFIQNASRMGGACTIKLTADANGGAISTGGGNAVFTALADGAGSNKIFHGPFNMGTTGSGTAQTANVFGAPFPAAAAAAVTTDFGVRHVFKLTDGDTALITSNLVVGGDQANFVACQQPMQPPAAGAPAAPAAPAAAPAAQSSVGNGPTTSSVTLGGSSNGKVTIAAEKGAKKAAPAKAKAKTAASPAKTSRKPTPTFRKPFNPLSPRNFR